MVDKKKIRILLTIARFDGHDRGIRYLARTLMDLGFEVIFARYVLPKDLVKTAIQEDVAVVGISFSVGGHKAVTADVIKGLKEKEMGDVLILVGGVIPSDDVQVLKDIGVGNVYGPGSSATDIAQFIKGNVKQ
ncbi:cobalamin B12-binding domain-containing protein [Thermodesulfobacteriota bacterium]